MTTTTNPEFLLMTEVAERLRIPLATLRDWRRDDKGPPAFKFEGQIRYRASELDAWIEARRVAGLKPTPAPHIRLADSA